MKTFKVKNYKGNLVESLKKFSDSHKGMKIVEACEDGDDLKIKAEESEQKIEEAFGNTVFILRERGNKHDLLGICTTKQEAKRMAKNLKDKLNIEADIFEWPLNEFRSYDN